MLLEESGIILDPGEKVVMQGKCKGKIPIGIAYQASRNLTRWQDKAMWKDINGELVLTNKRGFALDRHGRIRKSIDMYALFFVGVTVNKPLFGKGKLILLLNVGEQKAKRTELEVDNPTQWMIKIKEFVIGGQVQEPPPHYEEKLTHDEVKRFCMSCGHSMRVDDLVCLECKRTPISGTDTKYCPNCNKVIPTLAKFCSDCGARQSLL